MRETRKLDAFVGGLCFGGVIGVSIALWKIQRKKPGSCALDKELEEYEADKADVLRDRQALFSKNQSVSYSNSTPLMIVKGEGQYLIDEKGTKWLDTRNNVGHVGWQNERVTTAIQNQMSRCNSNSRYLHPARVLLAKKLRNTFKAGSALRENGICFFVNSGSEANELAFRLARAFTKGTNSIVVERAYHGCTNITVDLSPYKFLGRGGEGKPDWVEVIQCPDTYRGIYQDEDTAGTQYALQVEHACDKIAAKGEKLAGFFIESGMSVAGVILPPKNYLKEAYECVHSNGGVCIADEVQTGLGRFGDYFWGFEQQDVQPDIVTIGKPFGNGFPLAAVVCRKEIADSFSNGMEFFTTFGGNPVACVAGLAVLQEIEKGNLQKNASETGRYLKRRLIDLADTSKRDRLGRKIGRLIGDIRGSGFFQGIEFVRDRQTKEPATAEVSLITTRMLREFNILTTVDGAYDHVLVFKPPMCFTKQNVDYFVDSLTSILLTLGTVDPSKVSRTPT